MLFLLNESVLDIGEPYATFRASHEGQGARAQLSRAIRTAREVVFKQGGFTETTVDMLQAIASEIACSTVANAALFVSPAKARQPSDVAFRLAEAPITTLAFLLQQQQSNGPSIAAANAHVWRHTAKPAA